jgi:hypothetical protein
MKLCALAVLLAACAWCQSAHVERIAQPPVLDDFLSGAPVPGFTRITDFRQNKPNDGKPVSRETIAWIAYDDQNFYAAFLCKEQPGKVRARMARREDINSDDLVGVFLDTFHDKRHAFSFYVNPLGIQEDSINTEGQDEDYSFDTVWKSEGRLTPDGYAVLIAIPFRSLRFPNADAQTWGIGLARFIPAQNEASYWPYYTNSKEGFATQLAALEGVEHVSPGRNMQFIPYGVFGSSHFLNDTDYASPAYLQQYEHRAGLDAKVILHDSFTLDVTLNPDFSQVESDDPQVTVNQRFEVYFPEKRPFFLDNANYFLTPEDLFFSRRIVNPEYGARLTGKQGRWLAGLLAIDDRAPGQQLAPGDPDTGKHAVIGIARVQRELQNQSTLGLLVTNYNFAGNNEQVLSVDSRLRFGSHLVFTGQAVRSQASYTDGTHPQGSIFHAELNYSGLHLTARSVFRSLGPGFTSTLSYIPRVDIRQGVHNIAWKWLPARPVLKSFGPTLDVTEDWNHTGALQDWIVSPGFAFELTGNTTITAKRTEALEVYEFLNFRKHSTDFDVSSEISKLVGFEVAYGTGAGVNYDPATGVLPFLGASKNLTAHLTIRPSKKIKIDETYLFSHLSTLERSLIAEDYGGGAVFNNHLFRSELNYQFTRELSLRSIIDYNGVLPNESLIDLTLAKTVTADFLLTWLAAPGTAFYLGYTDTHQNLAIFPGMPDFVNPIGPPSATTGRQLFIKVSYLIRR